MAEIVRIKLDGLGTGKVTGKTKFKWGHVLDRMSAGRQKALRIAGAEVRRSVQRSMSNRGPKTEKLFDIGTVNGQRLVARWTQIPKPDKVTSWKTPEHPKGFLRSDIQYDSSRTTD